MKCILCNQKNGSYSRVTHTSDDYSIYKCSHCGLEHTYPLLTDDDLLKLFSTYSDMRANTDVVSKNVKRNLDLIYKNTSLNDKSLFLDFGCGNGEFIDYGGNNFYGVDLHRKTNSHVVTSIDKLDIDAFDCITLFGVLEHLNKPKEKMLELSKHLKENGYLVMTAVDTESFIPYLYRLEHLTYWSKNSFEKLAEFLGLKVVYHQPYTMIQKSEVYLDRILHRTPESLKDIIYNKSVSHLPEFVEVPTNEAFCIMKKAK